MLADAYARAGRHAEARDTWDEVLRRAPDEPDYLAAAAEARAQADAEHRFDARAVEYLQRALKRAPYHQRARFYLGIALRQQGKAAEAAQTWEPLLAALGPDEGATLRSEVDAARRDAGLPPLPAPEPAEPGANALTVTVALDPAFAARVRLRGDATVFVIARQPDGPPMPIAVEKHTVAELPLKIVLDDADGPMPTAKLSSLHDVEVVARISESGTPMRQPGVPASTRKDACHDKIDSMLAIAVPQFFGQRILVEAMFQYQPCRKKPVSGTGGRKIEQLRVDWPKHPCLHTLCDEPLVCALQWQQIQVGNTLCIGLVAIAHQTHQ